MYSDASPFQLAAVLKEFLSSEGVSIYVSEALARAYKLHVHDFFPRYIWGLAPPPPHTKKLATLLLPAFAHQKIRVAK